MSNFLSALEQISSQDIFFSFDPEVLDFTSNRSITLKIYTKDMEIKIPFVNDEIKIKEMLGLLQIYLGNENSILICWNVKNFLTYAKAKTGVEFLLNGRIFDLAILEKYQGVEDQCPDSFENAFKRIKRLISQNNWKNCYEVYNKVHKPLINVISNIEALGLISKKKKKKVYSFYKIDGQINGRMKCSNIFSSPFDPHALKPEDRSDLIPIGFDRLFVSFDFKHMEVTMLQWLSKDDYLGDLISNGKDTYSELWEAITNIPCNPGNRQKFKEIFLPVVYGLGAAKLAEEKGIPLEYSKKLIDKIYKTIPISMAWIKKQQDSIVDGKAKDYFGRIRSFDSSYKVRNFSVQSPASLICMHKLITLYNALKGIADIGMSIHDGYVLICNKSNLDKVVKISKQVLESDDELYPNLKFKTVCEYGEGLDSLQLYER